MHKLPLAILTFYKRTTLLVNGRVLASNSCTRRNVQYRPTSVADNRYKSEVDSCGMTCNGHYVNDQLKRRKREREKVYRA